MDKSKLITIKRSDLVELAASAIEAHRFIIVACQDRVRVKGFDPTQHETAVRIRAAVLALKHELKAEVVDLAGSVQKTRPR